MATPLQLLERKRDGAELSATEIEALITAYLDGSMPDYQMAAFLMAVVWRGMSLAETVALTAAMVASGATVDLSAIDRPCVDKHSTGGVGDKTTLVVAPLAASFGLALPKLSGRGLGHTGGTLDKLESIPGFRTDLSVEEMISMAARTGIAVTGATVDLVPADRRLYALRDVTGTVSSLPLIVASILSKKLAVGTRAIVLDVKAGEGAFFATLPEARGFADSAVAVGREFGRPVRVVITSMAEPLGLAIGNALEVREAAATLRGEGPEDLVEVCVAVAAELLVAAGVAERDEAAQRCRQRLTSGGAWPVFEDWITAQGGDVAAISRPEGLPVASRQLAVRARRTGTVTAVHALPLGRLAMELGAGRQRKQDEVDPAAGIVLAVRRGARVREGDLLATLHTNRRSGDEGWLSALHAGMPVDAKQQDMPPPPSPVLAVV